jgi:glutaconate CoA-transferase subunit B
MAIMGFDEDTREMYLKGVYPGISPQTVLENMSFEVDVSRCEEVKSPSSEELQVLRQACDPQRLILGPLP